jgi:chemotaxis protein CheX
MSDNNLNQRFISFAKPFISATRNVFETMANSKINPGAPQIKKEKKSWGDYSATLGLTGVITTDGVKKEFRGMLVISFPEQTYLKIASAILMEEHLSYNDDIADVGGEIVNIIVGNAKRDLNELGLVTEMAVPTMISGPEHIINYPKAAQIVLIPMDSDHGKFFMEICYSD